jgi:hypothetical protein
VRDHPARAARARVSNRSPGNFSQLKQLLLSSKIAPKSNSRAPTEQLRIGKSAVKSAPRGAPSSDSITRWKIRTPLSSNTTEMVGQVL